MTLSLEWAGQNEFKTQPLREWKVEGEVAGVTRSAGPLTFVTVNGAGHMVRYPFCIPVVCDRRFA